MPLFGLMEKCLKLKILMVLLTALSCYNTNKLSDTMNKFMDEPIDDEIEEKYKDL